MIKKIIIHLILFCIYITGYSAEKNSNNSYDPFYLYLCDTLTNIYVGGESLPMKAKYCIERQTEDYYHHRHANTDSTNILILFSKQKTNIDNIRWDAISVLSKDNYKIKGLVLSKNSDNIDSLFVFLHKKLQDTYGSSIDNNISNKYKSFTWQISDNSNRVQLRLKEKMLTLTYYNNTLCHLSEDIYETIEKSLTIDLHKDRDRLILAVLIIFSLLVINKKLHLTSKILSIIASRFN